MKHAVIVTIAFLLSLLCLAPAYAPTLADADVMVSLEPAYSTSATTQAPGMSSSSQTAPTTTAPNATGTYVYPHTKEYPTFDNATEFQEWYNALAPEEQMEYRLEMQGRAIFSMRDGVVTEADFDHLVIVALDYTTLFDIGAETEGEQLVKEMTCTIVNATPTGTILEFVFENSTTHLLCDFVTDLTAGEPINVFVMFDRY